MDEFLKEESKNISLSEHGNYDICQEIRAGRKEGEDGKEDESNTSLAKDCTSLGNKKDINGTEENRSVLRVNSASEANPSDMEGCNEMKFVGQENKSDCFKKPVLVVGPRRGRTVGKVKNFHPNESTKGASASPDENEEQLDCAPDLNVSVKGTADSESTKLLSLAPAQKLKEKSVPLPYKEPTWSGIPEADYGFEVLKDGRIIERIELSCKPFYVIGRLSTCDIQMAHPTISRYHAIVQYRKDGDDQNSAGFYVYDLGSTHGTFLNKYKIKPNIHVRIQVGHLLKFGNSTRMFILQGPDTDQEQESELTVTELREKRRMEQEERDKEEYMREMEEKKRKEREEEEGIDWGMGEDADEETDLSENPYAAAPNEDLYIDDPKKTLRGWFEREGYNLEYNVEEKGFGQFLCTVELPIGNGMIAEALVKGKKKESVVQCALEACRVLDRFGMLRQATHESRKRKAKNWEEDDFYDSDEDTFLDRTGAVEKKRQQRMQAAGKVQQEAETYDSLLKKYNEVQQQIKEIEKQYIIAAQKLSHNSGDSVDDDDDEDALDAYMTQLSSGIVDKKAVSNLKIQLQSLKSEGDHLRKLVNIAKPASLPELVPSEELSKLQTSNRAALVAAVKRKVKEEQMSKMSHKIIPDVDSKLEGVEEQEEEEDEEEEEEQEEADKEEQNNGKRNEDTGGNHDQRTVKQSEQEAVSLNSRGEKREQLHTEKEPCTLHDNSVIVVRPKVIGPSLPPSVNLNEGKDVVVNKNKKRSRQKEPKNVKGKMAQKMDYDYDESNPDYSVWVPPEGQTGDGRTKLNEKYGY
ncbi:kanadaptin isoform X2 [Schistocerca piceifrons]|uniref:kanadaptin isoform X2 n=1 Tax=Schistocerca piceifrons TaxID=274613 RepID=UPI001F5F18F7|nr:kanadaptin isoform X2 [Schistocerca piceifrons]